MLGGIISEMPWIGQLAIEGSKANVLLKSAVDNFDKNHQDLLCLFSTLERGPMYKSVMDLPMIEGDQIIMLAILLSNALHPKNEQRSKAIKNGSYVEIKSHKEAEDFLK